MNAFHRFCIGMLSGTILLALPLLATEPGPEHKTLPPQRWTISRNLQVQLPPQVMPHAATEISGLPLSPMLSRALLVSFLGGNSSASPSAKATSFGVVKPDLIVSDADTTNASISDSPHEVTEPAIMESRLFNRNTRAYIYAGYAAFMRFSTPTDGTHPLIRMAKTSDFSTWSVAPLDLGPPIPGGAAFDQSGDAELASHPFENGLHPYRVYCVGTTFNMTNLRGDTEISVWYTDNAGISWQRYPGIAPHLGNPSTVDFDDKPTIAVSWNTSTFGYAYMAFAEYTGIIQIHVYALNPATDQWEFRATPVTGSLIQCPRLDVNPSDGTLYLTWLDWGSNTINVATSTTQGASWSSATPFSSGTLLGPGADLLCSTNCVEARSMLMTRFNKTAGALEVVYHIRQGTSGAAVMENRFVSGSWGTPTRVSSNTSHDQWNGAIDCAPDGTCVVSYYDFDRQSSATPITYRLYARHIYITPSENDTLLYKTTEASDPSRFSLIPECCGRPSYYYLGEYQDVWYYDFNGTNSNGVWNAGGIYSQSGDNKGDVRWTRAQ